MFEELRTELRTFLAETGLKPTYLGFEANRDSRLVERLLNGGICQERTAQKLRETMQAFREKRRLAS